MPLMLHAGGMRAGRRAWLVLGCGVWIACAAPQAGADNAGRGVFAQGITTAQRAGAAPRFVAKGDALEEGDTISTGSRGFAVIGLKDGAKYTLRPRTVFAIERYRHDAGEESALLRLFKGGLRAVTGLIGKRNPTGVQLATATATIGIRGTDFDARLCDLDCEQELALLPPAPALVAAAPAAAPAAPAPRVAKKKPRKRAVARVARMKGQAVAVDAEGKTRKVVEGAPVFEGESVRTAPDSHAVVAFRDQSKVTVQAASDVKVQSYRDAPGQPQSFVMRLVRGGVRAVTGLIGKRNPVAVRLQTAVATIGIRGTGIDALCTGLCAEGKGAPQRRIDQECMKRLASQGKNGGGACEVPQAGDGLFLATWEGASYVEAGERTLDVPIGRTGFFNPVLGLLTLLPETPDFVRDNPAPRPDGIPIDFDALFGTGASREGEPGLYVWVREGHVAMIGDTVLDLGDSEEGLIRAGTRDPIRLSTVPRFMLDDPTPLPDEFDESRIPLFEMTVDPFLKPGSAICEP